MNEIKDFKSSFCYYKNLSLSKCLYLVDSEIEELWVSHDVESIYVDKNRKVIKIIQFSQDNSQLNNFPDNRIIHNN